MAIEETQPEPASAVATVSGPREPVDLGVTGVEGVVARYGWLQRVRALVLGPRGGGRTRRRASDAVRVALALLVVVLCIPLVRHNTAVELDLAQLVHPPPAGVKWLVTTLWFLGSFGLVAALVLIGLLEPRLKAVRQMALAALVALGLCLLLDVLVGPNAGRPPSPQISGFDPRFPIIQLAIAVAVALTGLPFLSRPMHRIVGLAVALAAVSAVVAGYGLPL